MSDGSVSPVLRTSRGRPRFKKHTLDNARESTDTSNHAIYQSKHTSSLQTDPVSTSSSLSKKSSLTTMELCKLKYSDEQGSTKSSKRQAFSTTPQSVKKTQKKKIKVSEPSPCSATTKGSISQCQFASLDDTLIKCDIETIIQSFEIDDKSTASNLSKQSEKPPEMCVSDSANASIRKSEIIQPSVPLTNLYSTPKRRVNQSDRASSKYRSIPAKEVYTSPNKFQLKIRKKLPAVSTNIISCAASVKAIVQTTIGPPQPNLKPDQLDYTKISKQSKYPATTSVKNEFYERRSISSNANEISILNSSVLLDPDVLSAFNDSFSLDDAHNSSIKTESYLNSRSVSPDIFADSESLHEIKFKTSIKVQANSIKIDTKASEFASSFECVKNNQNITLSSPDMLYKCDTLMDTTNVGANKMIDGFPNLNKQSIIVRKTADDSFKPKKQGFSVKENIPVSLNSNLLNRTSGCGSDPTEKVKTNNTVTKHESFKLPSVDHTKTIGSITRKRNSTIILDEANNFLCKKPSNYSELETVPNFVSSLISPPSSRGALSTSTQILNENSLHLKSPDVANVSQVSSVGSDNSTIESQNMLQRLQGHLQTSTQKNEGGNSTASTQQTAPLDTSALLRGAALTAALEQARCARSESEVLGQELGPFFGLPAAVQDLLHHHRGITGLYDWQTECVRRGLSGNNLLVSLPTSGGKTLVAEILMLRTLLVRNKHAIFILPYVAIVQEKVRGLSPLSVNLGFLLEEYAGSKGSYPPKMRIKKSVAYIATIEKATGLLNSFLEEGRAGEVGLVVVDEAHMLGDQGGRGALLEATITKLRHSAKFIQIVAMSATISNLQQLGQFLGAELYSGDFRPVKLRQYVKINDQVAEINTSALTDEELLTNHRVVNYGYSSAERIRDQDGIGGLVREVLPQHSVLVFCPTRRNCESLAKLLCTLLPDNLKQHNREAKKQLFYALAKEGGGSVCPVLQQVLPYGVAYHHSGLTEGERKLVEEGYLTGTLCVITCTSTLAAGVNLPARRVVLRSPYTGRDRLTRSRYLQMVGRAGRAGLDSEGESFLVLQQKDARMVTELVRGPVEVCLSRLCDDANAATTPYAHATVYRPPRHGDDTTIRSSSGVSTSLAPTPTATLPAVASSLFPSSAGLASLTQCSGLRDLVFSAIGLGLISSLAEARQLAKSSLMALQAEERGINLADMVQDVLEKLRSCGMLRIKDSGYPDTSCSAISEHVGSARSLPNTAGSSKSNASAANDSRYSANLKRNMTDAPNSGRREGSGSSTTTWCNGAEPQDFSDSATRQENPLLPHHKLVVSKLGRAAIKGCVELSISSRLYEDLIVARNSLAVHSRLHLLYLVTPYGAASEIPLLPQVFYQAFCSLKSEELKVAQLIGITEGVASMVAMGKAKTLRSDTVRRFNAAIIIHRLLSGADVWKMSEVFEVPRGLLQRTLSAAAAFASCVHHFCQELEELWAFRDLLASFSRQLSGCCSAHLLPLMDLPAVKLGRARMLYSAGFTSLHAVANANPDDLVKALHHLPRNTAVQLVNSAKALLLEKAEALQEEAEQMLRGLSEYSAS